MRRNDLEMTRDLKINGIKQALYRHETRMLSGSHAA